MAGHMVRIKDGRLPKISETKKQGGCRKRGRPRQRWEEFAERGGGRPSMDIHSLINESPT